MPTTTVPGRRTTVGVVRGLAVVVAAVAAAAGLGRALRTVGSTDDEVTATVPGDELLPAADVVTTRAVTIPAPASVVWPWLVQLGWGRAGWYSLDAVERLVGVARSVDADGTVSWRSLRSIVPAHQQLAVGDVVPLAAGVGLTVARLEPHQVLVLELDRRLLGHRLRWVWSLVVRDVGVGRSRLVARTRTAITPRDVGGMVGHLVLDPGHAVMELVQLRGIRDRATASAGRRGVAA